MGTVLALICICVIAKIATPKAKISALARAEAEEALREGRIC